MRARAPACLTLLGPWLAQSACGDPVTNLTFSVLSASLSSAFSSDVQALAVDLLSLAAAAVHGVHWFAEGVRRACGCTSDAVVPEQQQQQQQHPVVFISAAGPAGQGPSAAQLAQPQAAVGSGAGQLRGPPHDAVNAPGPVD